MRRMSTLQSARRAAVMRMVAVSLTWLVVPVAMAAPMGADDARHLLARTGFGPTSVEVREYALSRDDAIDRLLAGVRTTPVTPAPAWTAETGPLRPTSAATATAEERNAFQQEQTRRGLEMRAWWVQEMLATPSPLTERMTLFWHNHFVS